MSFAEVPELIANVIPTFSMPPTTINPLRRKSVRGNGLVMSDGLLMSN
jgi:hypothetical protein